MFVVPKARFERVYARYKATRRHVLVDKIGKVVIGDRIIRGLGTGSHLLFPLGGRFLLTQDKPPPAFIHCPVSLYFFVSRV